MEEPASWLLAQTVVPPSWLPDGWTATRLTRENGTKVTSYEDPVSRRRFRSKAEVLYFLETGKSLRSRKSAHKPEKLCPKPKEFLEAGESSRAQNVPNEQEEFYPQFVEEQEKVCHKPEEFLETGKSSWSRHFCHKLKLQELGRKLCRQAIHVFRKKDMGKNTAQQISTGQSTSMSQGPDGNLITHSNSFSNPGTSSTFHASSGNPQQGRQPKRIRTGNREMKREQRIYYVD